MEYRGAAKAIGDPMSSVTQLGFGAAYVSPANGERGASRSRHSSADGEAPVGPEGSRDAVKSAIQDQRASGGSARDGRQSGGEFLEGEQSVPSPVSVRFSVDRDLDKLVIRVVDKGSKEVVRQIPNDGMLDLAKKMQDLRGLLYDKEA